MNTRHHFTTTQPLFVEPPQGMAERWLSRKNPRRSWAAEHGNLTFGEYVSEALPDWSEPVIELTPYTEDTEATTNVYVTAPLPLTRTVYKSVQDMGDHRLAQRHSGTWRVLRNP